MYIHVCMYMYIKCICLFQDVLDEDVIPMCPPTPTSPPKLNLRESTKCLHSPQLVPHHQNPTIQLHVYEKSPQPQHLAKVPKLTLQGSVSTETHQEHYQEECSQGQLPTRGHVAVSKTQATASSVVSTVDITDEVGHGVAIQEAWTREELCTQSPMSCSPPLSQSALLNCNPPIQKAISKEKIVAEW